MTRILVWKEVIENGGCDIYHNPSKELLYQVVDKYYGGNIFNVGNKLWLQAIISEITHNECGNELTFLTQDIKNNKDRINSEFDCILYPMANIFNEDYLHFIKALPIELSGIKIPIYVVACGIQTKINQSIDDLISKIGKDSSEFIKSVYTTGGEFCLRGYKTKEFFDKLGFTSARVTGCPSLYQNGRDLTITKKQVSENDFKVSFNGNVIEQHGELLKKYSSFYICQDVYFSLLRNLEKIETFNELKSIARYTDIYKIELAINDKIKIFNSMDAWSSFLINNNITMSYGSRIHGSIVPILSGIPALISFNDGRVQEMADFYNIPIDSGKNMDLYEKYCELDYSNFNKSFSEKYDYFHKTLNDFGLVKGDLNSNNTFMKNTTINQLEFDLDKAKQLFYNNEKKLYNYQKMINLGRRAKRLLLK